MKLTIKSELDGLFAKLQNFRRIKVAGERWAENAAREMENQLLDNLQTQGRGKGAPPPLSGATTHLYKVLGEPDGSGISDHIQVIHRKDGNRSISIVGIPKGKPTMIAQVQDKGKVIRVTDKMRGWLAVHGIHLKPSTRAIRIPARKFWRKAWKTVRARRAKQIQYILRGKL